ncbi:helix-turn-helix transcriptional regulator [Streptomyces sp. S1A]|uniref:helix-turn-helix domain-containing protein n=1 Tax=Streptomyces sp. ICN903 TaxID=2964654 RepID=UPI001EDAE317|nr:helix-turn-helix transcriptional regulator [Streptomyces sp. ICN903]MCG3040263.1 helix-turn-helix transcriptional regulator [Streptomyces sp. ICN903]
MAANIARLRKQRGWDQKELAARVTEAGRAMSASVISKTEKRERRVDVDDLVAFAAALNVTPAALLLPHRDQGGPIEVAGQPMPWGRAWRWMHGEAPLPGSEAEDDFGVFMTWLTTNRPYLTREEVARFIGPAVPTSDADWDVDTGRVWKDATREEDDDG